MVPVNWDAHTEWAPGPDDNAMLSRLDREAAHTPLQWWGPNLAPLGALLRPDDWESVSAHMRAVMHPTALPPASQEPGAD